ncbi:SMI1/KNR4 family protein [Romboutsia sp.]|uniref:SMI1/KNR4 family protein n=1 Tax=Romboutsia sp. TaxID=1965302 RepID=UPI003F348DCD
MNTIQWQFTSDNGTIEDIKKIEEITNVKLPKEYVQCVLLNNGGYPDKNTFDIENEKGKVFEYLLGISEEDDEDVLSIYKLFNDNQKVDVVPFGMDPFGNYLCFKYNNKDEYNVIFLDHENKNEKFISKDFVGFINKLH